MIIRELAHFSYPESFDGQIDETSAAGHVRCVALGFPGERERENRNCCKASIRRMSKKIGRDYLRISDGGEATPL